jgi:hypothetical protein
MRCAQQWHSWHRRRHQPPRCSPRPCWCSPKREQLQLAHRLHLHHRPDDREPQQVVTPPVFSVGLTKPSTVPLTPLPESVSCLQPGTSPEVPYARFLSPSFQMYQLEPGRPIFGGDLMWPPALPRMHGLIKEPALLVSLFLAGQHLRMVSTTDDVHVEDPLLQIGIIARPI